MRIKKMAIATVISLLIMSLLSMNVFAFPGPSLYTINERCSNCGYSAPVGVVNATNPHYVGYWRCCSVCQGVDKHQNVSGNNILFKILGIKNKPCPAQSYHTITFNPTSVTANAKDVPVRSAASSAGSVQYRLSKGQQITIVGICVNSADNTWYLLDDANWIFTGNINLISGAIPVTPFTVTAKAKDAPVRAAASSSGSVKYRLAKGQQVTVVSVYANSSDNLWYKLSDGNWIYNDNVS